MYLTFDRDHEHPELSTKFGGTVRRFDGRGGSGYWPANRMLIYNFRTGRELQPPTMAVTQSTPFISLLRLTLEAHPMSQRHHHCSQSDPRLGLSDLINPRQVGSSGATSARAHCRRSVSKPSWHAPPTTHTPLPRCVETAFLKWIRRSNRDVLSTIFFTILLGSFAWPLWSNLKRLHCRLDDVFEKIEVLQRSIKVVVSSPILAVG